MTKKSIGDLVKIVKLQKELEEIKNGINTDSDEYKSLLCKEFNKFFAENKEVYKVTMIGYTPYFNDGSECVWHLADVSFYDKNNKIIIGDNYDYDEEYEDEDEDCEEITHSKQLKDNCQTVVDFIQSMGDIFVYIFGDHVRVTLRRDDNYFEIEEFNHD